jgi:hypothetical protein
MLHLRGLIDSRLRGYLHVVARGLHTWSASDFPFRFRTGSIFCDLFGSIASGEDDGLVSVEEDAMLDVIADGPGKNRAFDVAS